MILKSVDISGLSMIISILYLLIETFYFQLSYEIVLLVFQLLDQPLNKGAYLQNQRVFLFGNSFHDFYYNPNAHYHITK